MSLPIMAVNSDFYTREQLKQFWVGLMDGDGSVQVNHWREKTLQFRFVIKLKNTSANYFMLSRISGVVGGSVSISADKFWVLWVENTRSKIVLLLNIFDVYKPLTFRLTAQVGFMKQCLERNDVRWYLMRRQLKYDAALPESLAVNYCGLPYFPVWLSGFVEAEGCFSIRSFVGRGSFSIGQKYELSLLESIRAFFSISAKVRSFPNNFFLLETFKRDDLLLIRRHFLAYPLLGEKLVKFALFYKD